MITFEKGNPNCLFFLPTLKLYMNSNASLENATATLCDRVFAIIITPFCSYILKLWYLFQFAKWHNCQNPWCTSVWLVYYFILGTPANNHKENSYTRKMFEYIKRSAYTLFAINPLWFGKKFKSGSKRFCYFWMQDKNNVVHTWFLSKLWNGLLSVLFIGNYTTVHFTEIKCKDVWPSNFLHVHANPCLSMLTTQASHILSIILIVVMSSCAFHQCTVCLCQFPFLDTYSYKHPHPFQTHAMPLCYDVYYWKQEI